MSSEDSAPLQDNSSQAISPHDIREAPILEPCGIQLAARNWVSYGGAGVPWTQSSVRQLAIQLYMRMPRPLVANLEAGKWSGTKLFRHDPSRLVSHDDVAINSHWIAPISEATHAEPE